MSLSKSWIDWGCYKMDNCTKK